MYCKSCQCSFTYWKKKCPVCKTKLTGEAPPLDLSGSDQEKVNHLVELLNENNGEITVTVKTEEHGKFRKSQFPSIGLGFAWVKSMKGDFKGNPVILETMNVSLEKNVVFPGYGWGFAWAEEMKLTFFGIQTMLKANKVNKEKKISIFGQGWGYAWVESLKGLLGDKISVEFKTTAVDKDRQWNIFKFGWGYAWVQEAELTIAIVKS